ncbi:hypothetical protein [Natronosalvus vescus]|uniref:hypothetical protein n=1 Tax=Natronosalvus vescus TaxID=2953881 RepID=UPI0020906B68|nr:hypothetical protein [Natronosalvus vescus]
MIIDAHHSDRNTNATLSESAGAEESTTLEEPATVKAPAMLAEAMTGEVMGMVMVV